MTTETDAERLPDSPKDLDKTSWRYVVGRAVREFGRDQCTDLAAALTYFAVLALFPALVALVSLLGVFGQGQETVDALLNIVDRIGPATAVDTLRPTIEHLSTARGAGLALVVGLVGALWSASGYVGAFGRAMNRIYGVHEGRPIWRLRPLLLVVTLFCIALVALTGASLVLTGPVARAVGEQIGLGSTVIVVWDIVKWPVLLAVVFVIVALLYYVTPNVQQPKLRWLSVGAIFAIVVWILASVAFGVYVANFSSYDKTYGSLAGVIVFLLWLWLTNLALLFGAELDAELERGRQLLAGIEAEETLRLRPRDARKITKAELKRQKDIAEGRKIRKTAAHDPDDR